MTDRRKKARQERTERLGKKQVCQTQEFSHGLNVRFVFLFATVPWETGIW